MKRTLLIGLVLGMTFALTVPAMAVDWSASGFIAVTGQIMRNINAGASIYGDHLDEMGSLLTMRGRLRLTARASEDLFGVMYFEMDSNMFGEAPDGRNHIGAWRADRAAVEVKNVYIDFRIPPKLPLWMRIGVQTLAVRPNVLLFEDGAGATLRFSQAAGSAKLNATGYYAKLFQDNEWDSNNDAELYGLDFNVGFEPATVGMYFFYQNSRDPGAALGNVDAGWDNIKAWWIGGYADFKVSFITGELDFGYNAGSVDADSGSGNPDIDLGAWILRGAFSALLANDKLEAGIGGLYVSGQDYDETDEFSGFLLPGRNGNTCPATNDDDLVILGGWMNTDPFNSYSVFGPQENWPGIWYVRGFATYQILGWLKVGGQVLYIGDTEDNGDAFVGADPADGDSIGWEFDLGVNVNIYKNLQFTGGFGYLIAGDATNTQSVGVWDPRLGAWIWTGDEGIDDPWILVGSLIYSF